MKLVLLELLQEKCLLGIILNKKMLLQNNCSYFTHFYLTGDHMTINDYIEDAYIKGWNQGWGEGWEVGQEQERVRIARSLLRTVLPKDDLISIIGLSIEEIDKIEGTANASGF